MVVAIAVGVAAGVEVGTGRDVAVGGGCGVAVAGGRVAVGGTVVTVAGMRVAVAEAGACVGGSCESSPLPPQAARTTTIAGARTVSNQWKFVRISQFTNILLVAGALSSIPLTVHEFGL